MILEEPDYALLKEKDISQEQLQHQLERFKRGFEALKITSPATVDHGILRLSEEMIQNAIDRYEASEIEVLKFVPASGAASRMFKNLFTVLDSKGKQGQETVAAFFKEIQQFAFFDDLRQSFESENGGSFNEALKNKDVEVIASLLTEKGLNYGTLPKGLLRFHRYDDDARTPAQEHIEEGVRYAQKEGVVKIHFTVSPAHLENFQAHVEESRAIYPEVNIQIDFSTQKESTDTVAVDMGNVPFRDENGKLLFRPAGHGALLENLNQLNADIIFIKNIDNVVPDRLKETTIRYKKVLAGVLLQYQEKTFSLMERAKGGEELVSEGRQLLSEMGIKGDFSPEEVSSYLNRPIRVCGMVKNEGDTGGGPFWIISDGIESLQIVETAQVDQTNTAQQTIFEKSTHFNPVDIVCGLKNYKGEKFDLLKYRDNDTDFITEKSYQGKQIKAMELPGLWNGSMADWNTIFVEVPLITFNPVKTVMDLLKSNHR
ncbi:MAG: DUF4301 family protein [Ekhidna sp.]|nr:DUF4301 family protein [Ekhidna sp.]